MQRLSSDGPVTVPRQPGAKLEPEDSMELDICKIAIRNDGLKERRSMTEGGVERRRTARRR